MAQAAAQRRWRTIPLSNSEMSEMDEAISETRALFAKSLELSSAQVEPVSDDLTKFCPKNFQTCNSTLGSSVIKKKKKSHPCCAQGHAAASAH